MKLSHFPLSSISLQLNQLGKQQQTQTNKIIQAPQSVCYFQKREDKLAYEKNQTIFSAIQEWYLHQPFYPCSTKQIKPFYIFRYFYINAQYASHIYF